MLADSILGLSSGVPSYTEGAQEEGNLPRSLSFREQAHPMALVKIVRLARKIKLVISEEWGAANPAPAKLRLFAERRVDEIHGSPQQRSARVTP